MMNVTDIAFPKLKIYLSNVPQDFTVFGYKIALYGVVIALGMILGVLLASYLAKKHGYDSDIVWDFAIYGIIFGIIGARIYYVAFSWDYYKHHLKEIFFIRNGGMAIYGSVIAAFLVLFIYSKVKKIHYLTMADLCVPGLALGQAVGRWGNFFNREVFGEYTDNILAMRLPIDAVRPVDISADLASHIIEGTNYIQVHPTFLYECLWNLALVALMVFVWKYRKFDGQIFLMYVIWYGAGRFFIESVRTDSLYAGTLKISQVVAVISVSAALILLIVGFSYAKRLGSDYQLYVNTEESKRLLAEADAREEAWQEKLGKKDAADVQAPVAEDVEKSEEQIKKEKDAKIDALLEEIAAKAAEAKELSKTEDDDTESESQQPEA